VGEVVTIMRYGN